MSRPRDNSHHARRLSVTFAAVFLGIVLSSTFLRWPPDWPLAGVEREATPPVLTAGTWFDGAFAKEAERWLLHRFGLRGFAIRVANQLDYSLFGHLPGSRGTKVLQGRDGWLFESSYLRYYEEQTGMEEAEALETARKLAAIRALLQEKGVSLAIVVSPSKLEVYPEYLPKGILRDGEAVPAREELLAALRGQGLPVVDGRGLFLNWKKDPDEPLLFPEYGTHWNAYAAQRVLDELWRSTGREDRVPRVVGHEGRKPFGMDTDLLDLLNLLFYRGLSVPMTPYPVLEGTGGPDRRQKVLLVGDSFCFQLVDALGRTGAFSDARMLYYFRGIYDFHWERGERPRDNPPVPHRTGAIRDHAETDWQAFLDGYDLVILECNEIFARKTFWGFADFVLPDLQRPRP